MEMSPQRVRSAEFQTVRKGADPKEVKAFLDDVADELERAQNQSTAMEARARAAVARLQEITESGATAPAPNGDGTYLVTQPIVQHNGTTGNGFRLVNLTYGDPVPTPAGYVENTPKDMVTALPDQITRIRAKFDKPGRYVWHCHILSHEDHEMMRVLHVGPGA